MSELSMFGFRAIWSPYFMFFSTVVLCIYLYFTSKKKEEQLSVSITGLRHKISFVIGLFLFYLALGGPLDLLGHLIFSMHMTQMTVAFLMAIPLMIYGTPSWVFEKLFKNKLISSLFNFLTRPLISLFFFNGFFSVYHIPLIFDVVKQSEVLHTTFLVVLTILSITMWWPLLDKVETKNKLEGVKKIGYIFANGILITPACALIIFANDSLYTTYNDSEAWLNALALCVPMDVLAGLKSINFTATDFFGWLNLHEDQQLGGVIMKVMQEIVYGSFIGYVFFKWVREEKDEVVEPKYVKELREAGELI